MARAFFAFAGDWAANNASFHPCAWRQRLRCGLALGKTAGEGVAVFAIPQPMHRFGVTAGWILRFLAADVRPGAKNAALLRGSEQRSRAICPQYGHFLNEGHKQPV